jgi:hypothetical protein
MDSIQGSNSHPKQDTALNICAVSFLSNICPKIQQNCRKHLAFGWLRGKSNHSNLLNREVEFRDLNNVSALSVDSFNESLP